VTIVVMIAISSPFEVAPRHGGIRSLVNRFPQLRHLTDVLSRHGDDRSHVADGAAVTKG